MSGMLRKDGDLQKFMSVMVLFLPFQNDCWL